MLMKSVVFKFLHQRPASIVRHERRLGKSLHSYGRWFCTDSHTPKSLREKIALNQDIVVTTSTSKSTPTPVVGGGGKDSLEREKELYAIKRDMTQCYNTGNYEGALDKAVQLHDEVIALYGKSNAIYASCVNNIALMVSG
jgi:hypothetical protein